MEYCTPQLDAEQATVDQILFSQGALGQQAESVKPAVIAAPVANAAVQPTVACADGALRPIDKILAKLPSAKRSTNGWIALCPAHDDHHPSLSISERADGAVLLKCHAGCKTPKIVERLGKEMGDLFPRGKTPLAVFRFPSSLAGNSGWPEKRNFRPQPR